MQSVVIVLKRFIAVFCGNFVFLFFEFKEVFAAKETWSPTASSTTITDLAKGRVQIGTTQTGIK